MVFYNQPLEHELLAREHSEGHQAAFGNAAKEPCGVGVGVLAVAGPFVDGSLVHVVEFDGEVAILSVLAETHADPPGRYHAEIDLVVGIVDIAQFAQFFTVVFVVSAALECLDAGSHTQDDVLAQVGVDTQQDPFLEVHEVVGLPTLACSEPIVIVVGTVDAVGLSLFFVGEGDYVVAVRVFIAAELEGAAEPAYGSVYEEDFAQSVGGAEVTAAGVHVLDVVCIPVVGPESGDG